MVRERARVSTEERKYALKSRCSFAASLDFIALQGHFKVAGAGGGIHERR